MVFGSCDSRQETTPYNLQFNIIYDVVKPQTSLRLTLSVILFGAKTVKEIVFIVIFAFFLYS